MTAHQAITTKYIIQASFEVEGVVEKSDVIGALFGQTEGLFGPDLDLHELQKIGRIGRIEIQMESKQDKTNGSITIPSTLDKALTALVAAAVESIDRVGPCTASVVLKKIEDMREKRREQIVNRAKEILHKWTIETTPPIDQVADEVYKGIKTQGIVTYGPDKLSAGPDVDKMNELIIVEGRADVAILLKSGITNVIASEGTKIPQTLKNLSKKKKVTAFLDGDRGGDLILKALLQVAKVDYVAKAPRGKEVEDLRPKQVLKILKERVPIDKVVKPKTKERIQKDTIIVPPLIKTTVSELRGTLEAVLLDEKLAQIERMPVSELCIKLQKIEGTHTIVFDGVITQRLLDIAEEKGIKRIIGDRISGVVKRPVTVQTLTMDKLVPDTGK
ncbi:MAG: DNA primase [Candidatus Bathyarchaeota archaeon]|nr:MAG: DNA primase [Candidatus Bathyarchaeota archaeon]